MTALIVEEEHGTYAGMVRHPHNGYFAGDFSRRDPRDLQLGSLANHDLAPLPGH